MLRNRDNFVIEGAKSNIRCFAIRGKKDSAPSGLTVSGGVIIHGAPPRAIDWRPYRAYCVRYPNWKRNKMDNIGNKETIKRIFKEALSETLHEEGDK